MNAGELEIQPWSPGDAQALEAFALPVRGRETPFRPRSAAHLEWAFRANPAGARLLLARRAGRIVGAYGALPVRTRVMGETRTFACLFDAPLAPGEDQSTLAACARALAAQHLGPERDLVHYGWPAPEDGRTLRRELGYEVLRVQALFARECGPGPSELPAGVVELTRCGREADELYACCATHWHASAQRDAAFLHWRFLEHPLRRYRVLGLRSGEVLRGYAVYRGGAELAPGLGLLMDWLVLPGDDEASALLLAGVLACARAEGATALAGVFPEWSPWALAFQERGFRHHPSDHLQLVHSGAPRFDMLWLRDNWWNTLADVLSL